MARGEAPSTSSSRKRKSGLPVAALVPGRAGMTGQPASSLVDSATTAIERIFGKPPPEPAGETRPRQDAPAAAETEARLPAVDSHAWKRADERQAMFERSAACDALRRVATAAAPLLARILALPEPQTSRQAWVDAVSEAIDHSSSAEGLRVVEKGLAGGLKLADSTTGKFFKVPIVPELFHGKDPMAGKSAKQELGMVAWLSQQKGLECLSSHSAVIVDETVGGEHGEPGTVVRVVCQPFHQVSDDSLRVGSSDGGKTMHSCAAAEEVAGKVAKLLHLSPSTRPAIKNVAHYYTRSAGKELLRCGYFHSQREVPDSKLGPASRALPFDVELHALPDGSLLLLDAARLCIPEAGKARTDHITAVVWMRCQDGKGRLRVVDLDVGTDVAEAGGTGTNALTWAGEALSKAVAPSPGSTDATADSETVAFPPALPAMESVQWRPDTKAFCGRTGVTLVESACGSVRVLLARASDYWLHPHLTATFCPEAAEVLRRVEAARVSPDDAFKAKESKALEAATECLLGSENLGLARKSVMAATSALSSPGQADCVLRVRDSAKAALHSCGLGLRHSARVLSDLLGDRSHSGKGDSRVPTPSAELALLCTCFPSPGSPAASAIEALIRSAGDALDKEAENLSWSLACAAARAMAVKGGYLTSAQTARLGELLIDRGEAVLQVWASHQLTVRSRVKAPGQVFSLSPKEFGTCSTATAFREETLALAHASFKEGNKVGLISRIEQILPQLTARPQDLEQEHELRGVLAKLSLQNGPDPTVCGALHPVLRYAEFLAHCGHAEEALRQLQEAGLLAGTQTPKGSAAHPGPVGIRRGSPDCGAKAGCCWRCSEPRLPLVQAHCLSLQGKHELALSQVGRSKEMAALLPSLTKQQWAGIQVLEAEQLMALRRWGEATELLDKCKLGLEPVVGSEHPDCVDLVLLLAECKVHEGSLADAEGLLNECEDTLRESGGHDHPQLAQVAHLRRVAEGGNSSAESSVPTPDWFRLGRIHMKQGNFALALELLQRHCAAHNSTFARLCIAQCYAETNRSCAALEMFSSVSRSCTDPLELGTVLSLPAAVYTQLAQCYAKQGNRRAAKQAIERGNRALAARCSKCSSPTRQAACRTFSRQLCVLGEPSNAEDLAREWLGAATDPCSRLSATFAVAECLACKGQYQQALDQTYEASLLDDCHSASEVSSAQLAEWRMFSARCHRLQGDNALALDLLDKVESVCRKQGASWTAQASQVLTNKSRCQRQQGRYAEGLLSAKLAVDVLPRATRHANPAVAEALAEQAQCYIELAQYGNALHALGRCCSTLAVSFGPESIQVGRHLVRMAQCALALRDFDQAMHLLVRCERIQAWKLDTAHPRVASRLCAMAQCFRHQRKFDEALALLQKCLDVQEETLGCKHPSYARTLYAMAQCHLDKCDYSSAIRCLQQCREIEAQALGPNHPGYANTLRLQAQCKLAVALYEDAFNDLESCKRVYEETLGARHPLYAAALYTLAQYHRLKGETTKALELLCVCADIETSSLGPDHPGLANTKRMQAQCEMARGNFRIALGLLQECRRILEGTQGQAHCKHPSLPLTLANMALCHLELGEFAEAAQIPSSFKEAQEQLPGDQLLAMVGAWRIEAKCCMVRGRLKDAVKLLKACMAAQSPTTGEDNPDFSATLYMMAQCERLLGRYDQARHLLGKCAGIQMHMLGKEHPAFISTRKELALCLMAQGHLRAALRILLKCREAFSKTLGPGHFLVAGAMFRAAECQLCLGCVAIAERLLGECAKIEVATLGRSHPGLANTQRLQAVCRMAGGDFQGALKLLQANEEAYHEHLDNAHPMRASGLYLMAFCHLELESPEEAKRLLDETALIEGVTLGKDHPALANTLKGKAQCCLQLGQPREALEIIENCRAIFSAALGEDHPTYAAVLFTLARCHRMNGNRGEAEQCLVRCAGIEEQSLGPSHPALKLTELALKRLREEAARPSMPELDAVAGTFFKDLDLRKDRFASRLCVHLTSFTASLDITSQLRDVTRAREASTEAGVES